MWLNKKQTEAALRLPFNKDLLDEWRFEFGWSSRHGTFTFHLGLNIKSWYISPAFILPGWVAISQLNRFNKQLRWKMMGECCWKRINTLCFLSSVTRSNEALSLLLGITFSLHLQRLKGRISCKPWMESSPPVGATWTESRVLKGPYEVGSAALRR